MLPSVASLYDLSPDFRHKHFFIFYVSALKQLTWDDIFVVKSPEAAARKYETLTSQLPEAWMKPELYLSTPSE